MFEFDQFYHLTDHKVLLRPLEIEDLEELWLQANDPTIWTYFLEEGYGEEAFKRYVENALQNLERGIEYPMVLIDLDKQEIAGMTRIYQVDNQLKNAKIGHTWIGKAFQGTGLNQHMKYLLFSFLFDELHFERIGFGASAENTRSIQALKSIGCTQEGVLRSFMPGVDGKERVDIILMSILKDEWLQSVREELITKVYT